MRLEGPGVPLGSWRKKVPRSWYGEDERGGNQRELWGQHEYASGGTMRWCFRCSGNTEYVAYRVGGRHSVGCNGEQSFGNFEVAHWGGRGHVTVMTPRGSASNASKQRSAHPCPTSVTTHNGLLRYDNVLRPWKLYAFASPRVASPFEYPNCPLSFSLSTTLPLSFIFFHFYHSRFLHVLATWRWSSCLNTVGSEYQQWMDETGCFDFLCGNWRESWLSHLANQSKGISTENRALLLPSSSNFLSFLLFAYLFLFTSFFFFFVTHSVLADLLGSFDASVCRKYRWLSGHSLLYQLEVAMSRVALMMTG